MALEDLPCAAAARALIAAAFAGAVYPGDDRLTASRQSEESASVGDVFRGLRDWRALDPDFVDRAPGGYGSALSFFTDEAFRFYLPAYLLADLDDRLFHADPLFHLTSGIEDQMAALRPTLAAHQLQRLSGFTKAQCRAIAAYLRVRLAEDFVPFPEQIELALSAFWEPRGAE